MVRSLPISKIITRLKHGVIATAFIATQLVPFGLLGGVASAAGFSMEQCQNGTISTPNACSGSANWITGNSNASKSHWREGDSIPYRSAVTGLSAGTHTLTINWDTTVSGKHAIDYLTSYNRTETTADPCGDISGCTTTPPASTFPIPVDTHVTALGVTPAAGNFTLYDGTITGVSAYTLSGTYTGSSTTGITISFTTIGTNTTVVLAWGGHIASQIDWGLGNSASAINGSPYHTSLAGSSEGSTGSKDVQLMASAVLPTPTITTQASTPTAYVGQSVTDTATLSGPNSPLKGNVSFFVCGPSASAPNCASGGNQVGLPVAVSPGTGTSGTAVSGSYAVSAAGTYCFRAEYVPAVDSPYSPQNHTDTTKECFTATVQPGSITIIKDAVPQSSQDFAFTTTGSGLSSFKLDDDADPTLSNTQTFTNLAPGSYSISESATTGWDFDNIGCSQGASVTKNGSTVTIALSAGQSVTCTYTNRQRAHLVVNKVTNPANDLTGFSVTASGTATASGATAVNGDATQTVTTSQPVTYDVAQGAYSVSETVPNGWHQASNTCTNLIIDGNTPLVGGVPTVSCTITNTKLAKITIVKQTSPSSSTQSFSFTPSANLSGSNFSLDTDSGTATPSSQTFSDLTPGQTYTVTENTTSGWHLTGLTCSNGYSWDGQSPTVSLTPAAGDDITCTYTNTQYGSISGTKYEVNADGSHVAVLGGVQICIDANNNNVCDQNETSTTTANDGSFSLNNLLAGTYKLIETVKDGWTQIFGGGNVTITDGQNSTGNDFGNFQNASISGYKFNDQDGNHTWDQGEPALSDWTVNLTGTPTNGGSVSQSTTTDGSGHYSFDNLAPGKYTVCENVNSHPGYVQTAPTGNNGCYDVTVALSGHDYADNDFGNRGQGTIRVIKNLDDGFGNITQNVSGWTWNYSGMYDSATDQTASATNYVTVPAGSYTLTENGQNDYHLGGLSCTTTGQVGGPAVAVTVMPGSNVTCTYTNIRDTGTLVLQKHVVNDNGGTAKASDFNLHVTQSGSDVIGSPAAGSETGTSYTLTTGSYTVSEDAPVSGYTQTSIVCDGQATATVSVTSGENKICTITNDDVAPKLTLVKYVTNDNGGKKVAADFTLSATPKDNQYVTLSGAGGVSGSVQANVGYDLSEVNLSGYTPSAWLCSVGANLSGSTITLAPGDDVTCSITNDDIAPLITVTKTVINDNGGQLQVSDFPLYVGALQVTSGTQTEISVAGTYVVSEQGNTAYQASVWGGDCDPLGNITMVVGGVYNCSITNNDIAPQLTVIKHVINDNTNLTKTANDFTMNVSGTNVSASTFAGSENGTTVTLNAGSYGVTEGAHDGYDVSYSGDCTGSIDIGQDKTCTVTNTAILEPAIHVEKTGPANAYEGDKVTYTFTVTNTGNTPLSIDKVNDNVAGDGTYVSGDTNSNGKLDLDESWVYSKDYTIPAKSGDITNTVTVCGSDVADTQACDTDNHTTHIYHPTISVTKYVYTTKDSDDGTFNLQIDGQNKAMGGNGTTTNDVLVTPGAHTVAETGANGTDLSDYDSAIACYVDDTYIGTSQDNPSGLGTSLDDVAVQQDQHADCYIYNVRHAHLTIVKDAVPNDPQPFNFTLEKYNQCEEVYAETLTNLTDQQCDNWTSVDNFQLVDNTNPALASKTESLSAADIWTEDDSATYRVNEADTPGWDLTDLDCGDVAVAYDGAMATLRLQPGQDVTCTYTNIKRASLTIKKDAQPNSLQMFNFTSDIDGANSFSLMDDGTGNFNGKTMSNLLPGTYTIIEASSDNWTLNGVSCGDGVTMKLDGRTLTVTLAPGANVTCTFTNAQGAVLGATVTTPLVNTGNSIWVNVFVGLTALLTTLGLAFATRKSAKA